MKIKNVYTTNLHILKNVASDYNKERSTFPAYLSHILSKVVIFYELEEVGCFEMLGLDKIGKIEEIHPLGVDREDVDGFLGAFFTKEKLEELGELPLRKGIATNKALVKDIYSSAVLNLMGDAHTLNSYLLTGPIGFQSYNCTLTLSGGSILKLFGYEFSSLFEEVEGESLEKSVETKLIVGLMNAVYRELQTVLMFKDIYTNAYMYANIYKGKTEPFVVTSVFDNLGNSLEFVDHTAQEVYEMIDSATKSNGLIENRHWIIEIACKTSIAQYFDLMFLTSIHKKNRLIKIIDTEDMMVILAKDHQVEFEKGTDFLIKNNKEYINWFLSNMEKNEFDIYKRFTFAPASAEISYLIHLDVTTDTISELKNIISARYGYNTYPNRAPIGIEPILSLVSQVKHILGENGLDVRKSEL